MKNYRVYIDDKIISLILFVGTISGVSRFMTYPIPTIVQLMLNTLFIISLLIYINRHTRKYISLNNKYSIIKLYVIYVITFFCIGLYVQDNYFELKSLITNTLHLLLPIITFLLIRPDHILLIINKYIKYTIIGSCLILPMLYKWGIGWYLGFIVFPFLLFPRIPIKTKVILLIILVFVFISDFNGRSVILKVSLALLISFIYYFRKHISKTILKPSLYIGFTIPILLFILGINGIFNIFKIEDSLVQYNIIKKRNSNSEFFADTRSFIYEEQIQSAINNNYVLFGRTPARGFDSVFGEENVELIKQARNTKGILKIKAERHTCEVAILNIFNWFGVTGVILYTLIFFYAAKQAFESKNIFLIIIGFYIIFRYNLSWVEDMIKIDSSYMTLWLLISLCYSPFIKNMTEQQFILWSRKILTFKR